MRKIVLAILFVLCCAAIAVAEEAQKWTEYRFYCASSQVELHTYVNYYMQPRSKNADGGWQPVGGVVIIPSHSRSSPDELCQALVR